MIFFRIKRHLNEHSSVLCLADRIASLPSSVIGYWHDAILKIDKIYSAHERSFENVLYKSTLYLLPYFTYYRMSVRVSVCLSVSL